MANDNWDGNSDWGFDEGTSDNGGSLNDNWNNTSADAWDSWDNQNNMQGDMSNDFQGDMNGFDQGNMQDYNQGYAQDDMNGMQGYDQNGKNVNPNQAGMQLPQVNFGYKTIGAICVGVFILLALILSFFNKIKINKNDGGGQTQSNQQVTEQVQQQPQNMQQSSAVMQGSELADNVNIDYSASINQVSGVVQGLSRITQDGQIIYCISISIPYNNGTVIVKNYCTYGAYSSVNVGDMVNVKYQVVNGGMISVNEVTK